MKQGPAADQPRSPDHRPCRRRDGQRAVYPAPRAAPHRDVATVAARKQRPAREEWGDAEKPGLRVIRAAARDHVSR
ncbi:hypothetical protein AMYX_08710 [Anaeromyxobacter diazotrophicus]|uniref:Uncharacterized protein n=1 Tax=Anaeromyxobacter diazotrophicus TaxID=2590199 RepID=A0A7I9VJ29_9BACT|nr:hypothetical protein AMYX_08710 [Anaeromyxobacter diazotrophicus]